LTPEQHNKYLGWAQLAHGGLFLLMVIAMMSMMTAMFLSMPGPPQGPPAAFIGIMWVFMLGFYGLMLVPNLIAGYALLKKKSWAKTAAIIGAVTAAMSFPIGTAVCVYTFWFLFSEPGKTFFDKPRYALPPASTQWAPKATYQEQEKQYAPPPTPPDWR
jgi:hypothetical protein